MRLIDADAMIKRLEEWNTKDSMDKALYNFTLCRINEQQTIEERKTGKWEVTGERKFVALDGSAEKQYRELGYPHHNVLNMRCSNCNMTTMVDASIAYGYCPHCGAKMEEVKEDEQIH